MSGNSSDVRGPVIELAPQDVRFAAVIENEARFWESLGHRLHNVEFAPVLNEKVDRQTRGSDLGPAGPQRRIEHPADRPVVVADWSKADDAAERAEACEVFGDGGRAGIRPANDPRDPGITTREPRHEQVFAQRLGRLDSDCGAEAKLIEDGSQFVWFDVAVDRRHVGRQGRVYAAGKPPEVNVAIDHCAIAAGSVPAMIMARASSSVTSSVRTVPTIWPFRMTSRRCASRKTS